MEQNINTLFTFVFLEANPTFFSEGIINYLVQNAPALGILLYFAYRKLNDETSNLDWIKEQLKTEKVAREEKDDEISKLNRYIRISEKENLEILSQMNAVIQALTSNIQLTNTKLSSEIQQSVNEMKKYIDEKLKNPLTKKPI